MEENKYFKEMQRLGIKYRKYGITEKSSKFGFAPPYSEGQSFAYKFWAIADRYNANEVIVDDLPIFANELNIMLNTFVSAGIENIVIKKEQVEDLSDILTLFGCETICECKVFRQETQLYIGELEIINGIKMRIYK